MAQKNYVESDEDVDEEEAEAFNLMARNFRKGNLFGRVNRFNNGANSFGRGRGNSFGNKGGENLRQNHGCYNCREEGHFSSECPKLTKNKAFVGRAWSDNVDGDEPQHDVTCLMAIDSQELQPKPSTSNNDLDIIDLQKKNEEFLKFNKDFTKTFEKLLNEKRALEMSIAVETFIFIACEKQESIPYDNFIFMFSYVNDYKSEVINTEYEEHKGKIAIGRLHAGVLNRGMDVRICPSDDACRFGKVNKLFVFQKFFRAPAESVEAGDICAVCGIDDIQTFRAPAKSIEAGNICVVCGIDDIQASFALALYRNKCPNERANENATENGRGKKSVEHIRLKKQYMDMKG
ncbi:retrovirus-related pol polyprotein from transposon TNT 1-94 [Tanacetum coccineum]